MAVHEIRKYPDPVLKKKTAPIETIDDAVNRLIDDMVETMREAPGVGLAAPQVDVSLRVIVVEFGDEEDEEAPKKLYTMVNPVITRPSEEMVVATEACLSIPGFVGDVERHQAITIKGLNRFGKPMRVNAHGWLARIFQHEIDHLDGVLYIDKAQDVWRPEDAEAEVVAAD